MVGRINSRRINHFGAEIAQLHGLYITEFFNHISRADDTRVGSHKSIDIRPYFQNMRFQSGG